MKTFKLFGHAIKIRKKGNTKGEQINLTDAPQLVKDACKCNKCWNTTNCACNYVAKYLLEVGIDEFEEQAQKGTFPDKIKKAVRIMNYNLIFAYEVCGEYMRILEIAKGSWFN